MKHKCTIYCVHYQLEQLKKCTIWKYTIIQSLNLWSFHRQFATLKINCISIQARYEIRKYTSSSWTDSATRQQITKRQMTKFTQMTKWNQELSQGLIVQRLQSLTSRAIIEEILQIFNRIYTNIQNWLLNTENIYKLLP